MIKSSLPASTSKLLARRIFATSSHYSAISSTTCIFNQQQQQQYRKFSTIHSLVRNEAPSPSEYSNSLCITEACAKRIKDINEKKGLDRMLRVIVESGGCSGYQVEFSFSKEVEQDDQVFVNNNYPESKVIADNITMSFIKGSTIDFVESMAKTAFVLEKNPNAETGCSCGTSFSVKSHE